MCIRDRWYDDVHVQFAPAACTCFPCAHLTAGVQRRRAGNGTDVYKRQEYMAAHGGATAPIAGEGPLPELVPEFHLLSVPAENLVPAEDRCV